MSFEHDFDSLYFFAIKKNKIKIKFKNEYAEKNN